MGFSVKDPIRGSITGNAGTVNNHTVNSDVPANAKFTDTTYESKAAASGGTAVSLVTTGEKYTWNNKGTGTITKVQANGTDVASSGTANIPAASTSAYGVTKLSDATNSTSTALAATANAVKKAYDLANTANTGLGNKLDTYNGEVEAPAEGTINWHCGTLEASSYDNFDNYAQFQLYKDEINLMVNNDSDGITELSLKPSGWTSLTQKDTDDISSAGFSIKNDEVFLSTSNNDDEHSTYIQIKEANQSIYLYGNKLQVSQAPTTDLGIANKKYVDDAISALPEPMIFKGSLGTGGTITSLPTAAATNEGHTYKVITAGTYASQAAKAGDTFICAKTGTNTYAWTLIPSGDEPSGTVTSVTLKATSPIAIDSTSAITTSGTRTLSHANSGVTAGTYRSVTVNATGHVTAGTNPTTLSGYGITDAKIASGVITLGSNTITPLTSTQLTNQNLNDITTPGLYYAGGSNTTTNKPSNVDAYGLKVFKTAGGYTTQELIEGNTTPGKRWTRQNSGSWSSWTEMKMTDTDTKNTAGSTDSSKKLFLVGAESQAANPQTYSQDTAYVDTNGHLYSNSKQVVNLSDTQALTNKTYNGYTLAAASAKGVVTSVDTSANLPTSNAVKTFVEGKGYTTNTGTITGIKMNGASKGTSGVVDLGTVITAHQDISGKVNKSGDTMTGALNFANNVANKVGDDVSIGDFNKGGLLGVMGQNATTGIALIKNGSTWSASTERAEMTYNSTDKCIEFNFV